MMGAKIIIPDLVKPILDTAKSQFPWDEILVKNAKTLWHYIFARSPDYGSSRNMFLVHWS